MPIDANDPLVGDLATATPMRAAGGRKPKNYAGRQRKVSCSECGFIAYASFGALERCGFPRCACGESMQLANFRDRAELDYDGAMLELEGMSGAELARVRSELRRAGMDGLLDCTRHSTRRERKSGAAPMRCAEPSTYCTRWAAAGSAFCHEHNPARRHELERERDRRVSV